MGISKATHPFELQVKSTYYCGISKWGTIPGAWYATPEDGRADMDRRRSVVGPNCEPMRVVDCRTGKTVARYTPKLYRQRIKSETTAAVLE